MAEDDNEFESEVSAAPEKEAPELQIEVEDDTPEKDRNRPRRKEGEEPQIPEDDEIASYSEGVQKRIKRLKFEYHEERRAKEDYQRQLDQAAALTKKLLDDKRKMQEAIAKGEEILIESAKGKIESQLDLVKKAYKEAYEAGDTDGVIEAQERLAELKIQKATADAYRPVYEPQEREIPAEQYQPVTPPPADPKAVEWAKKNTWFGRDKYMTDYAKHLHDRIVVFDRIDPRTDEYWDTLNAEIRKKFPEQFDDADESESRPASGAKSKNPVVAPATRSNAVKPRTVKLTASEVALAKRLGLTVEQYAAEKMRNT
jgi:hypothetical protein